MANYQDLYSTKQKYMHLKCCLEALQSLDLTYDLYQPTQKKKTSSLNFQLERKKVSNLIHVAKSIIYIASMHTNKLMIKGTQTLLSKYLYRFRYFYRISQLESPKCQLFNSSNQSNIEINNIALEILFLLVKY